MTVVLLNISSILFKHTFVTKALSESSPVLNLLFLRRVYALNNEYLRETVSSLSPHKFYDPSTVRLWDVDVDVERTFMNIFASPFCRLFVQMNSEQMFTNYKDKLRRSIELIEHIFMTNFT